MPEEFVEARECIVRGHVPEKCYEVLLIDRGCVEHDPLDVIDVTIIFQGPLEVAFLLTKLCDPYLVIVVEHTHGHYGVRHLGGR